VKRSARRRLLLASNAVADAPRAAELGGLLFSEPRFSANGQVSCATCHQRERAYTDALPRSVGLAPVERNAMSLLGASWSPWFYWDGRKDSPWAQALEPLEHSREHGSNRVDVARVLLSDADYRQRYAALFRSVENLARRLADARAFPSAPPLGSPAEQAAWQALSAADQHAINEVFSRVGKVLAPWQRGLRPEPAPVPGQGAMRELSQRASVHQQRVPQYRRAQRARHHSGGGTFRGAATGAGGA
jgi:cytochrome c peroxidase